MYKTIAKVSRSRETVKFTIMLVKYASIRIDLISNACMRRLPERAKVIGPNRPLSGRIVFVIPCNPKGQIVDLYL